MWYEAAGIGWQKFEIEYNQMNKVERRRWQREVCYGCEGRRLETSGFLWRQRRY